MKLQRYDVWASGGTHVEADENGIWVYASDAETLEKRVEELDAIIKKMRNCHNCKLFKPYHNVVECNTCGDEGEGFKFWELKDE